MPVPVMPGTYSAARPTPTPPASTPTTGTISPNGSRDYKQDHIAQVQADFERRLTPSISRYNDRTLHSDLREVRWLDPNLVGPYNRKHDRLPKCDLVLLDDTSPSIFIWYHSLGSCLSATHFIRNFSLISRTSTHSWI
jgi:hypothetical protein